MKKLNTQIFEKHKLLLFENNQINTFFIKSNRIII